MRKVAFIMCCCAAVSCGKKDKGSIDGTATGAAPAAVPSLAAPPAAKELPAGHEVPGLTGVLSEEGFKALHELSDRQAPPARGEMVALDGSRAYLVVPEGGGPPFPAVVVIHEWWGLNEHIKHWADRLAADGYAALAVDLYGGQVANTPDRALEYMKAVNEDKAVAILQAAQRFVRADARVRAPRVASLGWCFGGGWSLQMALRVPGVDAAVMYYGRTVTDQGALWDFRGPLLGIFAHRDGFILPAHVDAFEAALKKAGIRHSIHRYDADHAFANPSGARYDEAAAADAWQKVRAFLAENLKKP